MKKIDSYIKEKLDAERYEHTKRVLKKAKQLAKLYNAPIDKVKIGAYLHDAAKSFKITDMLLLTVDKYPEVYDESYADLVISLVVAIDYVKAMEANSSNGS